MQREQNLATTRRNCAQHSPQHFPSNNLLKHLKQQYEQGTPAVSVLQVRELSLRVNKLQSWHLDLSHPNHSLSLHSTSATAVVGRRLSLPLYSSIWGHSLVTSLLWAQSLYIGLLCPHLAGLFWGSAEVKCKSVALGWVFKGSGAELSPCSGTHCLWPHPNMWNSLDPTCSFLQHLRDVH